jgi:site-specific DNA-methyltransferase (adenine-specific)
MQAKTIKLSDLHLNTGQIKDVPKNPRFIKDERYEALKKSIEDDPEMLQLRELVAYDNNGELVVILGNMRYRAMKELGYKDAPVKVLPTETDAKKLRAYIQKDNIAFGQNDWDLLGNEWDVEELQDFGLECDFLTDLDIDKGNENTMDNVQEYDFDPDSVQEDEIEVKLGDIFQLGNHRLMCGDSTKEEFVNALCDEKQMDMLLTDPPYNVDYTGKSSELKNKKIANDAMPEDSFRTFLLSVFNLAASHLKKGGAFYIWHADSEGAAFRNSVDGTGSLLLKQTLIWNKNSFVLGRQDYQWKHETCLYGWKEGGPHYFINDRSLSTVIDMNKPQRADLHPTMKPIELFAYCINNSSKVGENVLDLFGGSGTSIIASEQLGRKCYMMEFSPHFVNVIIKRWETLTGQKAIKLCNILDSSSKV